jgi:hypothetical protein
VHGVLSPAVSNTDAQLVRDTKLVIVDMDRGGLDKVLLADAAM